MTTSAQRTILMNIALRELHPEWMPSLEPMQFASATGSPWGRRWLARQLADRFHLFDPAWPDTDRLVRLESWVYLPSQTWAPWLAGLGALAFSERDALTPRTPPGWGVLPSSPMATLGELRRIGRALPPGLSDLEAERTLRQAGVAQLHHHALALHPFVADRIRSAFAPALTRHAPARVVPAVIVSAYLEAVFSPSGFSCAPPRTPQPHPA